MNRFGIVIHGGAGPDSEFIQKNQEPYCKGLQQAVDEGYNILEQSGSATDAVETAVNMLEDHPLFNAGRGAALNERAEVEMCAGIMNGKDLKSGAVAIVKNVKNPISLARAIMEKTKHIYIGNMGALQFAEQIGMKLMPEAYFITDHAFEEYMKAMEEASNTVEEAGRYQAGRKTHGTVGAVALDKAGNVAAGTSTGGTENQATGRIGDSSMIGIGYYANNKTCAISTTGDGEYLMRHVIAYDINMLMEYRGMSLQDAARYLLFQKLEGIDGDIGLVVIDPQGNLVMEFNSERMHRGWRSSDGAKGVAIYR